MDENNQKTSQSDEIGAYSVKDVAQHLGVSKATVLRWVRAKKIEGFFRIGHKWLIRKADFDSFISGQVAQQSEK